MSRVCMVRGHQREKGGDLVYKIKDIKYLNKEFNYL
jgi:hypothetical protein